jgi:hypothetical protein
LPPWLANRRDKVNRAVLGRRGSGRQEGREAMSGNVIGLMVTMLVIGACVGIWVHLNTKKDKTK